MSFILDALKKSEAERQRQSLPNLMDAGVAPRRRGLPLWAIIICTLLGLNALILGGMLIRQQLATAPPSTQPRGEAPGPRAAAHAKPPADAAQATPDATHFSPLDSAPVYAPEIPVDDAGNGRVEAPAAASARHERADPALNAPRNSAANIAQDMAESSAPNDEVLPEISELNLTGAQALPELHLDVHVYATTAADRFVYINMRKYREGAVLQDGLTLERIRRDGVVLNYQGLRFLLPRQ
jgi:general secretion pathway protein B